MGALFPDLGFFKNIFCTRSVIGVGSSEYERCVSDLVITHSDYTDCTAHDSTLFDVHSCIRHQKLLHTLVTAVSLVRDRVTSKSNSFITASMRFSFTQRDN